MTRFSKIGALGLLTALSLSLTLSQADARRHLAKNTPKDYSDPNGWYKGGGGVDPMGQPYWGEPLVPPKIKWKKKQGGGWGLTSIQCGRGQIRVAPTAAAQFEGFCRDLYAQYKFRAAGGYRPGHCSERHRHSCGGAIDIDQTCRSRGPGHCLPRNFPVGLTERLAAKWGLFPGSKWANRDVGHFQTLGSLAGRGWRSKEQSVSLAPSAPAAEPAPTKEKEPVPAQVASAEFEAAMAVYNHYAEYPPQDVPLARVRAALADTPRAAPREEIDRAAMLFGVSPKMMEAFARIESDFDPKQRTGSYKGLFQLSDREFNRYGSGNIYDARDNALAAANKFAAEGIEFERAYGRKPTFEDAYLIHQQGWEGAYQHHKHPDRAAWKSMCSTEEGRYKGEKWCRKAIWGNVPATFKRLISGGVEALTSGKFVEFWTTRVRRLAGISPAIAEPGFKAATKTQVAARKHHRRYARHHRHHRHHYARRYRHYAKN